jgi:hypothetical protein
MDFDYNDTTNALIARIEAFMDAHVYPNGAGLLRTSMDDPANRWSGMARDGKALKG